MIKIYNKYKEIVNYLIFGVLTTIVSLIVKWGLLFTFFDQTNSLEIQISVVISWLCAVIFAYITNRKYVFDSKTDNIIKEIISFFASRFTTLFIDMFIMWYFVSLLDLNSDFYVIMFTIISQVLIIILNYILSKLLVFKKNKN